jgi:hypothetical protein
VSYPNSGPLAVNGCSLSSVGSTERRAAPAACLAFLGAGDMLMMTKPDRLARSTAELLTIEADLPRWKSVLSSCPGAANAWHLQFYRQTHPDHLSGVATSEREVMVERQGEGIAKAAGQFGGGRHTAGIAATPRPLAWQASIASRSLSERPCCRDPTQPCPGASRSV